MTDLPWRTAAKATLTATVVVPTPPFAPRKAINRAHEAVAGVLRAALSMIASTRASNSLGSTGLGT